MAKEQKMPSDIFYAQGFPRGLRIRVEDEKQLTSEGRAHLKDGIVDIDTVLKDRDKLAMPVFKPL